MKTQMEVYYLVAFLSFLPCIQGSSETVNYVIILVLILIPTVTILICCCGIFVITWKKGYCKNCCHEDRVQMYWHIEQNTSSEAVETGVRHPYHRETDRCRPLYIKASGKRIIRHVPKSTAPSVSFSRVVATDVSDVSTTPARSSTAPTVHERMPRHTAISTRGTGSTRAQVLSSTSSPAHGNLSNQSAYVSMPSVRQECDSSDTRSPVISTIFSPPRHGLINTQNSTMPTISAPPAYENINRRDSSLSTISAPPPYDSTCMIVRSPTISSISSLPAHANENSLAPRRSGRTSPPPYEIVNTQNPTISTISAPPPPYENTSS